MAKSKLVLLGPWVIAGMVAGVGLVGMNLAIGQAMPGFRPVGATKATVDGMVIKGGFVQTDWPKLRLKLSVTNPDPKSRKLETVVQLVKQEFIGSPMSRVVRPDDTKRTVIESKPLRATLAAGKAAFYTVEFKASGEVAKNGRTTYSATVDNGDGKAISLGFIAPSKTVTVVR